MKAKKYVVATGRILNIMVLTIERFVQMLGDFRADKIIGGISGFVVPGESVLSVGDGDGSVSRRMRDRFQLVPQGLDVEVQVPFRTKEIPLVYYDGTRMPYSDNSFDIVAAVFSLHHCNDVENVLSEMIRVSRNKIIICEDVFASKFQKAVVCAVDYIENRVWSRDVNIPYNFRSIEEWTALFQKEGLCVELSNSFKVVKVLPVKNHLFCLSL